MTVPPEGSPDRPTSPPASPFEMPDLDEELREPKEVEVENWPDSPDANNDDS